MTTFVCGSHHGTLENIHHALYVKRHLPRSLPTKDELFAMRRAAWRKQGIAVLRPGDIRGKWARQAIVNEATRLYGRREMAR